MVNSLFRFLHCLSATVRSWMSCLLFQYDYEIYNHPSDIAKHKEERPTYIVFHFLKLWIATHIALQQGCSDVFWERAKNDVIKRFGAPQLTLMDTVVVNMWTIAKWQAGKFWSADHKLGISALQLQDICFTFSELGSNSSPAIIYLTSLITTWFGILHTHLCIVQMELCYVLWKHHW